VKWCCEMSISSGSGVAVPEAAGADCDDVDAGLPRTQLVVARYMASINIERVVASCMRCPHKLQVLDDVESVPATSASSSLRVRGGPPCNDVICWSRDAPLLAARRSLRRRALVCTGDSPGRAVVEAGESAMVCCDKEMVGGRQADCELREVWRGRG
jgi:hypothetical protein